MSTTPDASCTLDWSLMCSFLTDYLSYFAVISETTSTSGGWWGWASLTKDYCPQWDLSPSYYDRACDSITTTLSGEVEWITIKTWDITNSPYSTEMNDAYLYAYSIGITTMSPIQRANMTWSLIRAHMAKIMVNYAVNVLHKVPNTWVVCNFTDISNESKEMKFYAKLACQLGLMWLQSDWTPAEKFNPRGIVTRAQFGTVLSRALYGKTYNWWIPYYIGHLRALKNAGIIKNTNPDLKEIRWYVMLMLMRSQK